MNKVTAVLPTIGRLKYLDTAIKSILNQNKEFDEIVVFDNSKEQNLKEISIFKDNSSITFIKSGDQLIAIDSWNTAVRCAKNEYVTIIGDDDVLLPNYCENIHKILEKSEVGILKAIHIDENEKEKGNLIYPKETILTDSEFRKARFENRISLFVPGIVFKKELFLQSEGFKNTYIDGLAYSDELLLTQMSFLAKKIAISDEICWKYRIHSGQIGGVNDISTYVIRSLKYIKLYEISLINVGMRKEQIYLEFSKQEYIDKVCRYGMKLYGSSVGRNKIILVLFYNLLKYFIFDETVSLESRFKTTASTVKAFLGSTKLGKTIKEIFNR